ncbi:four-carbon acid sugar kinase family protein [Paracoccus sp. S-4012]|uniref:four-carbon acid sugar kinase family protein n=1 Tax=Paracoccus sp. S-4012 TaxID=2665648 RepID=UPI0012AFFFF7|nr:four-carbon acid sugar kinase family protein [Paracoccus sp. S-4012]MRX51813.1 four-carbon acid sugar kinase family protein [Paracoccus sp. S-4012]
MTPQLGIIADDFTGALLVAGVLEGAGITAPVFFDAASVKGEGAVLVLATRSRLVPVEEARDLIREGAEALDRAGARRLAYKACASFDSTEEGNIGLAAELLSDRAGGRPVLMSAGFPRFNATVHQGYLFYRGRLVSESVKRFDPLTPMSDPDVVRFLSRQTRSPVSLLSHLKLLGGLAAARAEWDRLTAGGARHVLADASDDGDVALSVELALAVEPVVVASDPLIIGYATALARNAAQPGPTRAPRRINGPGAVLVGSVGPTAEAQIAGFAAEGHEILTLDLLEGAPEPAAVARALAWAAPRIGARPFAIATTAAPDAVERVQAALGQTGAARKAERLLSGIGAGLRERGIRRLVVSGGETSGAVVAALGAQKVRALPETPHGSGFCVTEGETPMALFLKSGKLGADDVFARALELMGDP